VFPPEREHLPDFFYFASPSIGNATENAGRFSELSKARRHRQFVDLFTKEYPWIEDLSIEVVAAQPVIHATLQNMQEKIPLNSISGGINRLLSIILVMASHPKSVVVVDEIDNGLYYKHQSSFWRWLLSFARESDSQLFLSTHSQEWLESLTKAVGDQTDDICLWRIERNKQNIPVVRQFVGEQVILGIESGGVR
jgi:AAA15 family ATPase/GTPase